MNLIPISEAARRNGISRQRVSQLVAAGKIHGAVRIGTYWAVPGDWVYEKYGYQRNRARKTSDEPAA